MFNNILPTAILLIVAFTSCDKTIGDDNLTGTGATVSSVLISTDKAVYNPGDNVSFTIDKTVPSTAHVRYKKLGEVVGDAAVSGTAWLWKAPAPDFTGYLAEVYNIEQKDTVILGTVGVDVSSNWTKFPRYGFLSLFPRMNESDIKSVVDNLNRHHINGIQFYDWQYKHHKPLAGTAAAPTPVYRDIFNREIHFSTISGYINAAHSRNIKAMQYNLVYGAWSGAETDGVMNEWYVYNDNAHSVKDKHELPKPPFLSDIFLTDPSNTGWQNFIINENKKVYAALPFDGFHMDQLGDRGTRYKYDGTQLDLSQTFKPFIEAVKNSDTKKFNAMNAVNQYGQQGIGQAPVDFMYSELWAGNEGYKDLAKVIMENNAFSGNTKNTVLAAYMNYDLANNKGFFNTPGVLLTDAVIFAFGGSHLELGEHMLAREYFPNNNLRMKEDLKRSLVSYYDFLVGYQNLLRDGGDFNTVDVSSADYKLKLSNWLSASGPVSGQVSVVGKQVGNKQVLHLINFANANTLDWRDNSGTQSAPAPVANFKLGIPGSKPVKKIWFASPDVDNGASRQLSFTQSGNLVVFNVPVLQYWDMIVVEYQ